MISYLKGILVEKEPTRIVVDVAGVGYEVAVPLNCFDRLPRVDQPCKVLTYDHVREDAHQLYGFLSEDERRMFVLLMGVSGIGPKLALSVLSGLTVRELKVSVAGGDVKRLSSIPGVGKKTAERIVVDLRDKISQGEVMEAIAGTGTHAADLRIRDAVLALVALGYKQDLAHKMVMAVVQGASTEGMSVEELIRKALNT
jgi:Holliday junction DNA helicase RuvA